MKQGRGSGLVFFYVPNRKLVNSISVQSTDSIRLRILEQKEVHIMIPAIVKSDEKITQYKLFNLDILKMC